MARKRKRKSAPAASRAKAAPVESSAIPGAPPGPTFLASPAELGRAIRAARLSRSMTQAGLAARAHVSRRFVIQLEEGKPGVHLDKVLTVMMCAGLVGIVMPLEALQAAMGNQ